MIINVTDLNSMNLNARCKKGCLVAAFLGKNNYLFITYIVTSKPKRISVAAGVVHMISFLINYSLQHYNVNALCANL